jgi:hypothetical protein
MAMASAKDFNMNPPNLDLNAFSPSLPTQHTPFNQIGEFVHDDDDEHQHGDADEDIGGLEDTRSGADVKAQAFGGGDELASDRADDRERNAGLESGDDIGRHGRQDDSEGQPPAVRAHQARQVDKLLIELLHAGVGVKKVQKENQDEDDANLGPDADAEPDDEQRRQRGARHTVERDDDRLEDIGQGFAPAEEIAGPDAGERADGKADADLLKGDPGIRRQLAGLKDFKTPAKFCLGC